MSVHQHVITALVQNETGTLNRLVSLFRRRGFSLASLTAGDCEQVGYSRVTVVVNGDDAVLDQCERQLEKLIDVVEVDDLRRDDCVRRELALIKVGAKPGARGEVLELIQLFGGKVAHVEADEVIFELCDQPRKVDQLIALLAPYEVREVVRTGLAAMRAKSIEEKR